MCPRPVLTLGPRWAPIPVWTSWFQVQPLMCSAATLTVTVVSTLRPQGRLGHPFFQPEREKQSLVNRKSHREMESGGRRQGGNQAGVSTSSVPLALFTAPHLHLSGRQACLQVPPGNLPPTFLHHSSEGDTWGNLSLEMTTRRAQCPGSWQGAGLLVTPRAWGRPPPARLRICWLPPPPSEGMAEPPTLHHPGRPAPKGL